MDPCHPTYSSRDLKGSRTPFGNKRDLVVTCQSHPNTVHESLQDHPLSSSFMSLYDPRWVKYQFPMGKISVFYLSNWDLHWGWALRADIHNSKRKLSSFSTIILGPQ